MKLVLASQGFTTPEIALAVESLLGKHLEQANVAVVNEAYVGIGPGRDEKWLINELSLMAKCIKGSISFVNLRAYSIKEIERRLEFADLVYIVGGSQLVLPKLFRETGFDKLLDRVSRNKVIMGTSAGANLLGMQIENADYWQDQYGSSQEYLKNIFLGLAPFNILPHFEHEDNPQRTEARLRPLINDNPFSVYGIKDSQAVILNGNKTEFVGGDPVIFGRVNT
jgi:peptidase E